MAAIAEKIREKQDVKEMTRNAIKTLIAMGGDASEFVEQFEKVYGEKP